MEERHFEFKVGHCGMCGQLVALLSAEDYEEFVEPLRAEVPAGAIVHPAVRLDGEERRVVKLVPPSSFVCPCGETNVALIRPGEAESN